MEKDLLLAIASQAKRLLLTSEIYYSVGSASEELMRLTELIERFEDEVSELEPQLKPLGKKGWWERLDDPRRTATLEEVEALRDQKYITNCEEE